MHNVKAMRAFVAVAELGSFAGAANRLKVSTTSLSRLVSDFEVWLDSPLLRRSTRSITLTDAGNRYLEQCRSIIAAWDDLEEKAKHDREHPKGTLTVAGAAYSVRRMLSPHLPAFAQAYPDIKVKLTLQNNPVDLVSESVDVAFRLGSPKDNSLIAKKCGEAFLAMTASPDLIERLGQPASVEDLPDFPCLLDTTPQGLDHWPVPTGRNINYRFEANDGEIIRQMTLAGLGVSLIPSFFVSNDVKDGRLVRLFEEDLDASMSVYFVLPERKQITATARAFVEFVGDRIKSELQLAENA